MSVGSTMERKRLQKKVRNNGKRFFSEQQKIKTPYHRRYTPGNYPSGGGDQQGEEVF